MDIQKILDAMSDLGRDTRARYHLTLGGLKTVLEGLQPDTPVEFDDGGPVGGEDSYRGYYDDLAFGAGAKPSVVRDVLAACERALTDTYLGYKGGDYTYGEQTPLWRAEWGDCGSAIIAADLREGRLVLITKAVG